MQQLQIVGWMVTKEIFFKKINLGTLENPPYDKINTTLLDECTCAFTNLVMEFKDIFA
jgi:hypothetical protein